MRFAEYRNYDALGLASLIRDRQVSTTEVLAAAIARIEAVNGSLNAVVRKMYEEARRLLQQGIPDGPFTGVPFMLKDLYFFYAGIPTTNGSRLFADFVPDHHSTVVERYLAAGLLVLGKTNTPEYGLCAATEPALFGPTLNPWNPDHSPGGSSGGAAAAVAAGMLPLAHATDGGGSIRIPAANCGLFGLKPSRGRNPAGPDAGEIANGLSMGHCISRSVRDSAALLDASCGPAPGDPYAAPARARPFSEELGAPPGELRIALMTTTLDGTPLHPECTKAAEHAALLCEELGHRVEPAMPALDLGEIGKIWRVLSAVGLWQTLRMRAGALSREPRPEEVERITWLWAQEGKHYSGVDFLQAVQAMHRIGRRLGMFFRDYDLLLSSTMAQPPLRQGAMNMTSDDLDDYYQRQLLREMPITPLFNLSGGPAMSVPLHWSDAGLPVGIHFGADFGREALLFRLASQLEEARPWFHRVPG